MKKQVTILGAGITGLTLGYYLKERFQDKIDLKIVEKTDRPGGWIRSIQSGPFLFEQGPRTLRCRGGETTLELIEKIGLKDDILMSKKEANIRYILKEGKLEKNLFKGKRWPLFKGLFRWGQARDDESVYSFAERRFSKEVAEDLFATLALGIFAGDIHSLSLKHCFPTLYTRWPLFFSLFNCSKGLFTLRGGLEKLPKRLAELLKDNIDYSSTTSTPTFSTIPLLKIPQQSVSIAQFGWEGKQLHIPGFGYLIPKGNLLGVVFDSEIFPESGLTTRLSVMMREPNQEEALEHVKKVLRIEKDPTYCSLTTARNAIPQYPPGFDQILEEIHAEKKETTFIGSSYTGVSVNECIRAAKKAAYAFTL